MGENAGEVEPGGEGAGDEVGGKGKGEVGEAWWVLVLANTKPPRPNSINQQPTPTPNNIRTAHHLKANTAITCQP